MQDVKIETRSSQIKDNHNYRGIIITIIAIIFVFVAGYAIFGVMWHKQGTFSPDSFYAAFLTNGQVYFGKIEKKTRNELVLNNVYYLQTATSTRAEPQFNLVKLGQELHGPTDRLVINIDHLMFYEELKEGSAVVQSIKGTGTLTN